MDILVISGSTREGSFNTRLAHLVAAVRPEDAVRVRNDLDVVPFYNGDVEAAGIPRAVQELRSDVASADVVVFVTPEYNGTVPGVLANAVEWLSRPARESVLQDTPVLVLSASPTAYGGTWAAEHLRGVLTRAGAAVRPAGLSVATAHQRLGQVPSDPELLADLGALLADALDVQPPALSA